METKKEKTDKGTVEAKTKTGKLRGDPVAEVDF